MHHLVARRSSVAWVARDFLAFVSENKKWWLVPVVVVLALLALLLALGATPLAPFIYAVF